MKCKFNLFLMLSMSFILVINLEANGNEGRKNCSKVNLLSPSQLRNGTRSGRAGPSVSAKMDDHDTRYGDACGAAGGGIEAKTRHIAPTLAGCVDAATKLQIDSSGLSKGLELFKQNYTQFCKLYNDTIETTDKACKDHAGRATTIHDPATNQPLPTQPRTDGNDFTAAVAADKGAGESFGRFKGKLLESRKKLAAGLPDEKRFQQLGVGIIKLSLPIITKCDEMDRLAKTAGPQTPMWTQRAQIENSCVQCRFLAKNIQPVAKLLDSELSSRLKKFDGELQRFIASVDEWAKEEAKQTKTVSDAGAKIARPAEVAAALPGKTNEALQRDIADARAAEEENRRVNSVEAENARIARLLARAEEVRRTRAIDDPKLTNENGSPIRLTGGLYQYCIDKGGEVVSVRNRETGISGGQICVKK